MGGLGCLLPTYEKESKQKKQSQSWLFFLMSLIIKRTTFLLGILKVLAYAHYNSIKIINTFNSSTTTRLYIL